MYIKRLSRQTSVCGVCASRLQFTILAVMQHLTSANMSAGTTAGQDLNLSMDRLVSSRNFTNKLWNAGKFILFNLEQLDDREWQQLAGADFSSPDALADLPLAERWVVSALHQVRVITPLCHLSLLFLQHHCSLHFIWLGGACYWVAITQSRHCVGSASIPWSAY